MNDDNQEPKFAKGDRVFWNVPPEYRGIFPIAPKNRIAVEIIEVDYMANRWPAVRYSIKYEVEGSIVLALNDVMEDKLSVIPRVDAGDFFDAVFTVGNWVAVRGQFAIDFVLFAADEIKKQKADAFLSGEADEMLEAEIYKGFLMTYWPEDEDTFDPLKNDDWVDETVLKDWKPLDKDGEFGIELEGDQ